jgi:hypothetical protein
MLLYDGNNVGTILARGSETFYHTGYIELSKFGNELLPMWKHIERTQASEDPPYPAEWMDDDLWEINIDGSNIPIYFPMVYSDGSIRWQHR